MRSVSLRSPSSMTDVEDRMSLEIDVMRFVAIIAFCMLILIQEPTEQAEETPLQNVNMEQVMQNAEHFLAEQADRIRDLERENMSLTNALDHAKFGDRSFTAIGSIGFESDAAFLKLVESKDVTLYSRSDDVLYQVSSKGAKREIGDQEMTGAASLDRRTIPLAVIVSSGLKRAAWSVSFDAALQRNLLAVMLKHEGEPVSFVIKGSGQIVAVRQD